MTIEKYHASIQHFEAIGAWYLAELLRIELWKALKKEGVES